MYTHVKVPHVDRFVLTVNRIPTNDFPEFAFHAHLSNQLILTQVHERITLDCHYFGDIVTTLLNE